jgi:glycosyltransferase involved in cell wall biosynthesis
VNWRIVGASVCGKEGITGSDFRPIQAFVEPPLLNAASLSRAYAWADAVVMVSRFEGVPLTILEAQQLGCVVLSTNVGAIDEIVEPGRTGYLFSNDLDTQKLAGQMVACLRELQANRARLMRVARASAALRRGRNWSANFEGFARFVETLLGVRGVEKT